MIENRTKWLSAEFRVSRWLSLFVLVLMVGWIPTPSLLAQEEAASATAGSAASEEGASGEEGEFESEESLEEDPEGDARSSIEQILREDEDVMTGAGYTYDSGQRRDPFRSLISQRKKTVTRRGPRPEGRAGLLIDEIILAGVFRTPEGTFAQVLGGPKNKSYLIQAGDELYDGEVVEVRRGEVVFRQQIIDDPGSIKPFREVIKQLEAE